MCRIEENIGLCYKFAKEYHDKFHKRIGYDDIFQIACLGLTIANKNFDESKGVKFSTHASNNIKFLILNSMRDDKWYLGKRRENLDNPPPMSLDIEYGDIKGRKRSGYDFVGVHSPHEVMDLKIDLQAAMNGLSDTEKKIIDMFYFQDIEIKEISREINRSSSMATFIKRRAIKKIRKRLKYNQ